MNDEKLKPCPFCGFEEPEIDTINGYDKQVICNKGKGGCGARIGWYLSVIELRKAWNRRTKNA